MSTHEKTAVVYRPVAASQRLPLREAVLLVSYHLRLLNWWLFVLVFLGVVCFGGLLWLELFAGGPNHVANANGISRFVMESGAGLCAAMLTSSLLVGDPLLEVIMATRTGLYRLVGWRYLLAFCLLLLCFAMYLAWSLANGSNYTKGQTPLSLLLVWLVPVLVMSLLSLFGSLATRNAALGMLIGSLPLIAGPFLYNDLFSLAPARLFVLPYTFWGYNAPDWWANRLTFLIIALVLIVWDWWWLRHEERLLGNLQ